LPDRFFPEALSELKSSVVNLLAMNQVGNAE
jgi:hypothetical protein